jgi:hypothetical protein
MKSVGNHSRSGMTSGEEAVPRNTGTKRVKVNCYASLYRQRSGWPAIERR